MIASIIMEKIRITINKSDCISLYISKRCMAFFKHGYQIPTSQHSTSTRQQR
jgi:hypothetical protein